jgi:hypothetical protein
VLEEDVEESVDAFIVLSGVHAKFDVVEEVRVSALEEAGGELGRPWADGRKVDPLGEGFWEDVPEELGGALRR